MNLGELLATWAGTVLTFLTWLTLLSFRMGRISVQIETMWDFFIRRARLETAQLGWGTMRSPLELSDKALDAVRPFLDQLLPFYSDLVRVHPHITERELFTEFHKEFGNLLVESVCLPHNMPLGACILAAIRLCEMEASK